MRFFKKNKTPYPEMQKINNNLHKITANKLYLLELETRLIMEDAKSELAEQLQYDKEHIQSIVEDRLVQSSIEYEKSKKQALGFFLSSLKNTKNIINRVLLKVKIK